MKSSNACEPRVSRRLAASQPRSFGWIVMARVVDASAIGALLFGEQDGPWVHAMVSGLVVMVPGIFQFELGNTCWTKLRRHPGAAEALLNAWSDWAAKPPVVAMPVDLISTMQLARETNLTFYDASYLWLA